MYEEILNNIRLKKPVVHCITNYVTVTACANALLAAGASPIMADDGAEAAEITSICGALCLNIGTLNERTKKSMLISGAAARERGIPIVLDPVGAGASRFRTEATLELIEKIRPTVIRGNLSEIKAAGGEAANTRGVDVSAADSGDVQNAISAASALAAKSGAVVVVTGAVDIVSDGARVNLIHSGSPIMASTTGTGCMLAAVTAGFLGAAPSLPFDGATAAAAAFALSGEIAAGKMKREGFGIGLFPALLIDELGKMGYETFSKGAKIESR